MRRSVKGDEMFVSVTWPEISCESLDVGQGKKRSRLLHSVITTGFDCDLLTTQRSGASLCKGKPLLQPSRARHRTRGAVQCSA